MIDSVKQFGAMSGQRQKRRTRDYRGFITNIRKRTMSSLRKIKTKTGEGWRIEIMLRGDRKSIFLGKTNKKTAETVQSRVDQIHSCNLAGLSYPADVSQWLGTVPDDIHGKLSKVGNGAREKFKNTG
jgi:hypothetical protein